MKGGRKEGQAPKWSKAPKKKESAKQSDDQDFSFVANDIAFATISGSDWLADSGNDPHSTESR